MYTAQSNMFDIFDEYMNPDAMAVDGPDFGHHEALDYSTHFNFVSDDAHAHAAHAATEDSWACSLQHGADQHASLSTHAVDLPFPTSSSADTDSLMSEASEQSFLSDLSSFDEANSRWPSPFLKYSAESPVPDDDAPSLTVSPTAMHAPLEPAKVESPLIKLEEVDRFPSPQLIPLPEPLPTPPRSRKSSLVSTRVVRKLPTVVKKASASPSLQIKRSPSPVDANKYLPSPNPSIKRPRSHVEDSDDEDEYKMEESDDEDDDDYVYEPRARTRGFRKAARKAVAAVSRNFVGARRTAASALHSGSKKPQAPRRQRCPGDPPAVRGRPPKAGRINDPRPNKKARINALTVSDEEIMAHLAQKHYRKSSRGRYQCPVSGCHCELGREADVRRHLVNQHSDQSDEVLYAVTDPRYRRWCLACDQVLSRADARERHEHTCKKWEKEKHGVPTRKEVIPDDSQESLDD
ncbi:uncharacterized protein SCHCODRAFT_02558619 [Schizophyllum commune H4-8]|nr:uncharacterized protein SCHCODRAFT_02558619 [Schizophyllum commune H4-8]KAI5884888.1 hypothetical protein SCHCODRAFT_02558619 [Schizophyllum commune H4-8]